MAEDPEQGLDASVAALWQDARTRALARVEVIEDAVAGLLAAGAPDAGLADRARREAHKLAGSLGTFGMPEGTDHVGARAPRPSPPTLRGSRTLRPSGCPVVSQRLGSRAANSSVKAGGAERAGAAMVPSSTTAHSRAIWRQVARPG